MSASIFRPIRIVGFAFFGLLVLGLVASALLTIQEGRKLAEAQKVFGQLSEFQRVHVLVTRRLILLGPKSGDADKQAVHQEIDHLQELSIDPETPEKLKEVHAKVDSAVTDGREVLLETIVAFQDVGLRERASQAELLHQLQRDTVAQLQIDIAIPIALLAAGIILYPFARRRILAPLDAFGRHLTRVGEGDLTPTPTDAVDPFLLPLHRRFNELVARLRVLEERHAAHTSSLEDEVRAATGALLEQQRGLARAERLAATGELAASVAHELRNPLAGIQMSLRNLRAEISDAEVVQRIDRVVLEVERLSRLLNQLLDSARHAPEEARDVRLDELVADLLSLVRHQLRPEVKLENRVPEGLVGHLPPDRLRQAVLNLVLNAAAALGEKGGAVTVSARLEGTQLRLEVLDDGPGFPPEVLEGGVRPFFSTRERGTGLGLAMVRRFARDCGGEVELANRSPHGARVTLLLPSPA